MIKDNDPQHLRRRNLLRTAGIGILALGLIFTAVGIGSFFLSFGSFGSPKYFWCAFVGMPLMFVGSALCKFGFLGAVTRHMANEVMPVGKDSFNYMAAGTKDSVRDLAQAASEGFQQGASGKTSREVACPKCGTGNDESAKFCDNCGAALPKERTCTGCGAINDANARFCDSCGKALG